MDVSQTLIIVLIVLVSISVVLLVLQYIFKPKANLTVADIVKEIEEQNARTLKEVQRENEHMLRFYKELNTSLAERISQYNIEVSKNIETSTKFQRESFEGVSARMNEILKNNETRLERINQNVSTSLEKIQVSNEKKLNEMRQTVDEKLNDSLEKRLSNSFSLINERLESVYKGLGEMQKLATGVGDLKKVLTNVKTRGTWGEVQLGNLLEQMLSPHQYAAQVQLGKDENTRVDYAVVMPGRDDGTVYLPIDAKYPMEAYERLVTASEAGDVELVEISAKELERRIKDEAKKISERYIRVPATTDFAIMYLPLEGLFAEVIKKAGLAEGLQRDFRVMVCGPTTLSALLNSLQMGFKTIAIEKRSSEIWALLTLFKSEFGKFTDLLDKTQKKLNEASNTIESATKKTVKINKRLQAVNSLEPSQAGNVEFIGLIDTDDEADEEA